MAKTYFDLAEERGVPKGKQRIVQLQLAKLFGPLNAVVQRRLAALPIERIEQIGDALLTASSLRELGLED